MTLNRYKEFFCNVYVKIIVLMIYIISVNLLSGYLAVGFKFPSLWGNSQIFLDYAMPFGLTWALAHWPSIIIFTIPLLMLPHWNEKLVQRFRVICLSLFLILIYGVIEKIPFALFSAVDSLTAFFISLLIRPPCYKETPKLVISLSIFSLLIISGGIYSLHNKWQQLAPDVIEPNLMEGLFKLNKIEVDKNYKQLTFNIDLTQMISEERLCQTSTEMVRSLFKTYSFDNQYKRIAMIYFNPKKTEDSPSYSLGGLEQYIENGESNIACYLKYK
jgi:hypothetical protein